MRFSSGDIYGGKVYNYPTPQRRNENKLPILVIHSRSSRMLRISVIETVLVEKYGKPFSLRVSGNICNRKVIDFKAVTLKVESMWSYQQQQQKKERQMSRLDSNFLRWVHIKSHTSVSDCRPQQCIVTSSCRHTLLRPLSCHSDWPLHIAYNMLFIGV